MGFKGEESSWCAGCCSPPIGHWLLLPLSSYDTENGVQSSPYSSQARSTCEQGGPFCMRARVRIDIF